MTKNTQIAIGITFLAIIGYLIYSLSKANKEIKRLNDAGKKSINTGKPFYLGDFSIGYPIIQGEG